MKQTLSIVFIIFLVIFSYYFIDRQLVGFLEQQHARDSILLTKIASFDLVTIVGAWVFLFYVYFAIKLAKFSVQSTDKKLFIVCNSIVISAFLKDIFKIIFGRYQTISSVLHYPSFLTTHAYGFNWLKHDPGLTSFPSGHATIIFAFATSMWLLFPALRWLWASMVVLVVIGTLGMYYHFLSDVIAGAALGSTVALFNHRYLGCTLSSAGSRDYA